MNSLLGNPVAISVYVFVVLCVVFSFGEPPLVVAQHILVPFTVDVSRGFGGSAVPIFRAVTLVSQLLVFLFMYLASRPQSNALKVTVSLVGILLVAVHFLIVAIGFVVPRFH
ncbi:MAG: hypothetical protein AAFN50_07160 [Pseudomonadota bacterium]